MHALLSAQMYSLFSSGAGEPPINLNGLSRLLVHELRQLETEGLPCTLRDNTDVLVKACLVEVSADSPARRYLILLYFSSLHSHIFAHCLAANCFNAVTTAHGMGAPSAAKKRSLLHAPARERMDEQHTQPTGLM